MLLSECQIWALGLLAILGMAEMTLFVFSTRTPESRGNRILCCFTVLIRGRESAGRYFNSSALMIPLPLVGLSTDVKMRQPLADPLKEPSVQVGSTAGTVSVAGDLHRL